MKKYILGCVGVAVLIVACATSPQKVAYTTLYGLEQGVVASYDGYVALVLKGSLPTNDVPKVAHAFNTFQASAVVALDAVEYNTNAIAPANLMVEGQDVINLITTVTGKK